MSNFTPEQKEAIEYEGGNIMVSASAGSGKTRVMIERALHFVCNKKAQVDEILALTFTESAAKEMKDRLKDAVLERISKGDESLAEQYEKVQSANFSTIDSFCASLIRKYFYVCNLSPDFSVADEVKSKELQNECIEKVFRELYEEGDKDFLLLSGRFKKRRNDFSLKEWVIKIAEKSQSVVNFEQLLNKYQSNYGLEGYENILKIYEDKFKKELTEIKDRLDYINVYVDAVDEWCTASLKLLGEAVCHALKAGLYGLKNLTPVSLSRKPVGKKVTENRKRLINSIADLKELFNKRIEFYVNYATTPENDKFISEQLLVQTQTFVQVVLRFIEEFQKAKSQENFLDFNDLEQYALKILKDDTVREEVRGKFKHVFVDEYQDVNEIQEELIKLVSDNNLFAVGDAKQSIYGFRGSLSVFNDRLQSMKKKGEKTVNLNKNFRSADAVIENVNKVFSYCMTKELFGESYSVSNKLIPGGLYKEGEGRFNFYFIEKEEKKKKQLSEGVYDIESQSKKVVEDDASITALTVGGIIGNELGKKFYDLKEKRERYVTYSDIAVLTRQRDNGYVQKLVSGLTSVGIPVSSDVKQNICEFPEVLLLIHVLKLIDSFRLDVPLVNVLKSPIGNFTEEELAEIASFYSQRVQYREGFYQAVECYIENAEGELKDKLLAFIEYFDKIRFLSDFMGAPEILNKVIEDCDYEVFLRSEANGEGKVNRVKRFIDLGNENGASLSVRAFIKKIENSGDKFTLLESAGEGSIKLSTMHSSKGLEYPVVIVCGLERAFFSRDESDEVIFSNEYGVCLKYYDDQKRVSYDTMLRGVVKTDMREKRVKEEMRLFYVALTRAKYALYLVSYGEDSRKEEFHFANKFCEYIPKNLESTEIDRLSLSYNYVKHDNKKVLIGEDNKEVTNRLKENFAWQYEFFDDTKLKLKSSVTEAVKNSVEIIPQKTEYVGETNTEIGTIAHIVMENYQYGGGGLSEQVKDMIENGVVSEEDAKLLDLTGMQKVLDALEEKLKGYTLYREKSFLSQIDANRLGLLGSEKVLVQGIIDLLAIDEDKAIVVDYKYSKKGKDALIATYAEQINLYAEAVSTILNKKIQQKMIVNIFSGEVYVI